MDLDTIMCIMPYERIDYSFPGGNMLMNPVTRFFSMLCCLICVCGRPALAQPEGSPHTELTDIQPTEKEGDSPSLQLLKSTKVRILDPHRLTVPMVLNEIIRVTRKVDPEGMGVNIVYFGKGTAPSEVDDARSFLISGEMVPDGQEPTRELSTYEILQILLKAEGLTYRVQRNILVVEEKPEEGAHARASEPPPSAKGALERKLLNIPVRDIHFVRAPLDLALEELVRISREMDPDGAGVNIVLFPPKQKNTEQQNGISRPPKADDPFGLPLPTIDRPSRASPDSMPAISLKLRGVTLYDAVTFSVQKAGFQYRIQHGIVIVEPVSKDKEKQVQPPEPDPLTPDEIAFEKKLRSIPVKQIHFRRAQLYDVIDELFRISKEMDPERQGVSMVFLDPEPAAGDRREDNVEDPFAKAFGGIAAPPRQPDHILPALTMELRNVTLFEVWTLVMEMADLHYRIEDGRVLIEPVRRGPK